MLIDELEKDFELYFETKDIRNSFTDFINRLLTDMELNEFQLDIKTLIPQDGFITKKHMKKIYDWHNEQLSKQTKIVYVPLYDVPMI